MSFTWDCSICGKHLESLERETFSAFSERVYDTHTVYHDSQATGIPGEVLRRNACLALHAWPVELALIEGLTNLVGNRPLLTRQHST